MPSFPMCMSISRISIISIILPDPEDDDDDEEERIVWRDLVTGLTGDSCQCLVCQV